MLKEQAFISIIVYITNSARNLERFISSLDSYIYSRFENFEIILVNDSHTETTLKKIESFKSKIKGNLAIINLGHKQGGESAMLAGTDIAIGDYIIEIESTEVDFPFSLIAKLFKEMRSGFDIVSATPDQSRRWTSRLFYKFLDLASSNKLELKTETVRIISRRALNAVLKSKAKVRYRKALYKFSGFPFKTIAYKRTAPKPLSDKSVSEKLSLAFDILILFSDLGIRVAFTLAVIFLLLSIFGGIYAVLIYLTDKKVIEGWTTIMLFLSFGFSGIFIVLGILTKYISVILSELQDKPSYTVSSIKRISKN